MGSNDSKRLGNLLGDALAVLFAASVLVYLAVFTENFLYLTQNYRVWMGGIKFMLLAPFGALIAGRIFGGKRWVITPLLLPKMILWGLTGAWITIAFVGFSAGADAIVKANVWPQVSGVSLAFTKSLGINSCFAFSMMFFHEVAERWACRRLLIVPKTIKQIVLEMAEQSWFGPILLFIVLFWMPYHTITFSLSGDWQVIFAATGSVILGLVKALIANKGAAVAKVI